MSFPLQDFQQIYFVWSHINVFICSLPASSVIAVSLLDGGPSPALVLAEMTQTYSVNGVRSVRVVETLDPFITTKGDNISSDVLQLMVNPVMMPLAGSGVIHEAESVFGDPSTVLRLNNLGAEGTRKYDMKELLFIRIDSLSPSSAVLFISVLEGSPAPPLVVANTEHLYSVYGNKSINVTCNIVLSKVNVIFVPLLVWTQVTV